jgi:hypothetical protein
VWTADLLPDQKGPKIRSSAVSTSKGPVASSPSDARRTVVGEVNGQLESLSNLIIQGQPQIEPLVKHAGKTQTLTTHSSVLVRVEAFLGQQERVRPRSYQLEEIPDCCIPGVPGSRFGTIKKFPRHTRQDKTGQDHTSWMVSTSTVFVVSRKYRHDNHDTNDRNHNHTGPEAAALKAVTSSSAPSIGKSGRIPISCESPLFDEYSHFTHALDQDWQATRLDILLSKQDVLAIKNVWRPLYGRFCTFFTAHTILQKDTKDCWDPYVMPLESALEFLRKCALVASEDQPEAHDSKASTQQAFDDPQISPKLLRKKPPPVADISEAVAKHLLQVCSVSYSEGFDSGCVVLWSGPRSLMRSREQRNQRFRRSVMLEVIVRLSFMQHGHAICIASQALQRWSEIFVHMTNENIPHVHGRGTQRTQRTQQRTNNAHREEFFYTPSTERCFILHEVNLEKVFDHIAKPMKVEMCEQACAFKTWSITNVSKKDDELQIQHASKILDKMTCCEGYFVSYDDLKNVMTKIELHFEVADLSIVVIFDEHDSLSP